MSNFQQLKREARSTISKIRRDYKNTSKTTEEITKENLQKLKEDWSKIGLTKDK